LKGFSATYNQSYRAVQTTRLQELGTSTRSFQLIIPYIEKFKELNPSSTATIEKNPDSNNLKRVFVCPGIMNRSLLHVRPIMSLDAAHLKSQWKGTLYVASVKSACDEIYPVAVAIMEQNENFDGWRWFLVNVRAALPTLLLPHPRQEVTKKYFSFVCDRQKGLLDALEKVFPENHSCFCTVHIARNVQMKHGGKRMAKYILPLAATFSPAFADELLGKLSEETRSYVEDIPACRWRNTAWLEDEKLPPRYGVRTSNMSEATNSMFEKARDGSWLHSLYTILTKMTERIALLRDMHEGKCGVVERVLGILKQRWEWTAQYRVTIIRRDGEIFSVFRKHRGGIVSDDEGCICANLDLERERCSCGEWQEHGIPCVHALAYFKDKEELLFEEIVQKVDKQYTYEMENELLNENIVPVCIDRLFPDRSTLPPGDALQSRPPGRPRKRRIRARSKWASEPEKSPIVCSRCGKRGHNVRTCVARENLEDEGPAADADAKRNKKKKKVETIKEIALS
jgi:MULE transposase domain/SWIM zinc finger